MKHEWSPGDPVHLHDQHVPAWMPSFEPQATSWSAAAAIEAMDNSFLRSPMLWLAAGAEPSPWRWLSG